MGSDTSSPNERRGKLTLEKLKADAVRRGFSKEFAAELGNPHWRAYFVDTVKLQYFAQHFPSLLLFPWERMRAMGILQLRNPTETEYTFFSHQWQTPGHPWPDLLQVTEHIESVRTPFIWCDSRGTSHSACRPTVPRAPF